MTSVDEANADFFVDVTKDNVESVGWDTPPADAGWDASALDRETFTVPVREERIAAEKHERGAGEVTVDKHVVEQQQEFDVPVTHEEVDVTRRRVDRPADADDQIVDEGETIRVPVRAEDVDVRKEARVVEEVEISKRPVTETGGSPRLFAVRRSTSTKPSVAHASRSHSGGPSTPGGPHAHGRRLDEATCARSVAIYAISAGLRNPHTGTGQPADSVPEALRRSQARNPTRLSRGCLRDRRGHGSCLDATDPALELLGTDMDTLRMLRVGDLTKPETPDSLTRQLIASATTPAWLGGTCELLRADGASVGDVSRRQVED